jgi:ATP-dependent Clp protease adaptor protein ClpS
MSTQVVDEIDQLQEELLSEGYVLILHNDDHNTFDWVIECLMDLVEYTYDSASRAAYIVHHTGKFPVVEGSYRKVADLHEAFGRRDLTTSVEVI